MRRENPWIRIYCGCVALALALAGLVHFAALVGGETWLSALHAPPQMIAAYSAGDVMPYVVTSLIGVALIVAAFYLSGAVRYTPRLWLTTPALIVLSLIFWARGLILIPLVLMDQRWLIEVDAFGVVTSVICVLMAIGFTLALFQPVRRPSFR